MQSDLEALAELVPPPETVPAWDVDAERALGFPLPPDHVALLRLYGPGEFQPDLALYVPGGAPGGGLDLARLAATYTEIHEVRAAAGEIPIPAWPAPGGLLPWASDTDAGTLHFVTQGPPERWTVALVDYEEFVMTPLAGTSSGVLLALHRGTLSPPQIAGGALAKHRRFVTADALDR